MQYEAKYIISKGLFLFVDHCKKCTVLFPQSLIYLKKTLHKNPKSQKKQKNLLPQTCKIFCLALLQGAVFKNTCFLRQNENRGSEKKRSYHQVRVLHEAEDDLIEYRSKVRFELDRDPLAY